MYNCEVGFRQKSGSGSPTMGDQIKRDSLAHIVLFRRGILNVVSPAQLHRARLFSAGKKKKNV